MVLDVEMVNNIFPLLKGTTVKGGSSIYMMNKHPIIEPITGITNKHIYIGNKDVVNFIEIDDSLMQDIITLKGKVIHISSEWGAISILFKTHDFVYHLISYKNINEKTKKVDILRTGEIIKWY